MFLNLSLIIIAPFPLRQLGLDALKTSRNLLVNDLEILFRVFILICSSKLALSELGPLLYLLNKLLLHFNPSFFILILNLIGGGLLSHVKDD